MFERIGIIGAGVLGQAMKNYFKDAIIYSPNTHPETKNKLKEAEIIFICVPTPYLKGKGFDLSAVEDSLKIISGQKVIVIRSTVLPGTTDKLQTKFPQHQILFNPEFLTEQTAKEDYAKPDKQLIGYTEQSQETAEQVLNILPPAPFQKILPARTVELVKYMINNYYALKVIFANQFYDLAVKLNIDYSQLKEAFVADKRIADSHFEIWHKGYRGYGGKCLPKDVRSLIQLAKSIGVDSSLLEVVEKINNNLSSGQV